jgi:hypothetical protein
MKTLRLDLLMGHRVRDVDGRVVGRLEEARLEKRGGDWVAVEFHLGTGAALERFSASVFGVPGHAQRGWAATWEQMDWTDPRAPRLRCRREELRRFRRPEPPRRGKRRKK